MICQPGNWDSQQTRLQGQEYRLFIQKEIKINSLDRGPCQLALFLSRTLSCASLSKTTDF